MSTQPDETELEPISNAYLAIMGPPTDKKGLCIWAGERVEGNVGGTIGTIAWQPMWQAFEINQVMKNPPSATIDGNTIYVFYPSTSNETSYLYYHTCNTGNLEWSGQQTLTYFDPYVGTLVPIPTATGVGTATFNGEVYVFWQGVGSSGTGSANGTLFYRTMSNTTYHQVNAEQGIDGFSSGVLMSDCPAAVTFNGQLYVFYQGPGDSSWMWYTHSSDGSTWSPSAQVPNTGMSESPSTAIVTNSSTGQQELYVFHQGYGGNGQLWFNVLNAEGNWAGDRQVPNVSISAVPTAGVYDGLLYVFYQGSNTSTFWYIYSSDQGNSWSEPTQVANLKVSITPSIAEYNSILYLVTQGPEHDGILWQATFTPGASNPGVIPMTPLPSLAQSTAVSPSIVGYNGNLYCVARGPSSGQLLISEFDGSTWGPQNSLPGCSAVEAPCAVVYGSYLYVFFQGSEDQYSLQSFIYGEWDNQVQVPGAWISATPSAVVFNGKLYVFYEGQKGDVNHYYNILDTPGSQTEWSEAYQVPVNHCCEDTAPVASVFNNEIFLFYLSGSNTDSRDSNQYLYYTKLSADGQWSPTSTALNGIGGWSSHDVGLLDQCPPLTAFVYDGRLYCVYQQASQSGYLYYVSTADGSNWSQPSELSSRVPQATAPGAFHDTAVDWSVNALSFFI